MIIIYGTPACGFCIQAKNICTQKGVDYTYVDLSETTAEQQKNLMKIAGKPFRTVPQVFHKGFGTEELRYIGGFTDLKAELDTI